MLRLYAQLCFACVLSAKSTFEPLCLRCRSAEVHGGQKESRMNNTSMKGEKNVWQRKQSGRKRSCI